MKVLQVILISSVLVLGVSSCPSGSREIFEFPDQGPGEGHRLIKTSAEKPAVWLNPEQIAVLIENHANFVDVTGHNYPIVNPEDINTKAIPDSVQFEAVVRPLLALLDQQRVYDFIEQFSSYHTRYYTSTTGIQSQQWLLEQVRAAAAGYAGEVSVEEFTHSWNGQKSIIARITGSDSVLKEEVAIVGAHQDSINRLGTTLNAPGADDNGSGSAIVLETLRVIVMSGFIPKRTLEFHWYAAEEIGLRGAQEIAESYKNDNVNVIAMVNYDVAGYKANNINDIGIYTDYTNAAMNEFMRVLVSAYCEYGWRNVQCGYGCSDHAAWTSYGFPAAMPSEVIAHPQMHTVQDSMANVNFPQVMEFLKLSVAYVVEIAEQNA